MSNTPGGTTKTHFREQALANRKQQENKDELSRRIVGACMSLPEYAVAETVLFYVDVRSEVRTQFDIKMALSFGKKVVVPWCMNSGELGLFRLTSMDQLAIDKYGILEPKRSLRQLVEHQITVTEIDVVMVPGVAFDVRGGRIGHGQGYYDKLLQHARPETPLIGLAFECQVFDEIPIAEHDIFMDRIVTEERVYDCGREWLESSSD